VNLNLQLCSQRLDEVLKTKAWREVLVLDIFLDEEKGSPAIHRRAIHRKRFTAGAIHRKDDSPQTTHRKDDSSQVNSPEG
jgi:hypothetical protein